MYFISIEFENKEKQNGENRKYLTTAVKRVNRQERNPVCLPMKGCTYF